MVDFTVGPRKDLRTSSMFLLFCNYLFIYLSGQQKNLSQILKLVQHVKPSRWDWGCLKAIESGCSPSWKQKQDLKAVLHSEKILLENRYEISWCSMRKNKVHLWLFQHVWKSQEKNSTTACWGWSGLCRLSMLLHCSWMLYRVGRAAQIVTLLLWPRRQYNSMNCSYGVLFCKQSSSGQQDYTLLLWVCEGCLRMSVRSPM